MVADYEKQSGNTIDASIIPFAPLMQKIVSSLTSGDVPDVMEHNTADATVIPQNAWRDKLVDLSDLVQPLKSQFHPAVSLGSREHHQKPNDQQPVHKAPRLYHCESNTHARGRVPRTPLPATLVDRGIGRLLYPARQCRPEACIYLLRGCPSEESFMTGGDDDYGDAFKEAKLEHDQRRQGSAEEQRLQAEVDADAAALSDVVLPQLQAAAEKLEPF